MSEPAHSHGPHSDHSHGHGHDHAHDDHEAHYRKIYWILLVLLVVSVVGPFVGAATGIWAVTLFFAFGIALVKAYLVVKNFMHLDLEPKFVAYLCATALAFMGLLFFFVGPDVMEHEGRNWSNEAAKAVVAAGQAGHAGGEHGTAHEETAPDHEAAPTHPVERRPVQRVIAPIPSVVAPAPEVAPTAAPAAPTEPTLEAVEALAREQQGRAGFIADRLLGH